MTLSIDSSNFQISSSFGIPESLRQLLYKAWQNRYEEFYEKSEDDTIDLEKTLLEILDTFQDQDDLLCHARYICTAVILALSVQPTVKAYLPDDQKTEKIFQLVVNWSKNGEVPTEQIINQLFPQISVGCQAIDEALSVFKSLLEVLNFNKAQEAVLELLDYCLEGYTIFPGSQGRRDLFKWCLLEVVPAAWCLRFPESIYTIKGIIPLNSKFLPNELLGIFDSYRNQDTVTTSNIITDIPIYIENRIRQPISDDLCIVKNSIPVISFGDPSQAKVVTVSINPSDKEFLNDQKEELVDNERRFGTLTSLDISNLEEIPITKIEAIYQSCLNYFNKDNNPYKKWFNPLEELLNNLEVSYYNGSACHLDLVQWATSTKWNKISKKIQKKTFTSRCAFSKTAIRKQ